MKIILTPEAGAFIRKRGGHLRLFASTINGCCGVGAGFVPMFEISQPHRQPERYLAQEVEGLAIHLDKALAAELGQLHIGVTGRLWQTLALTMEDER